MVTPLPYQILLRNVLFAEDSSGTVRWAMPRA